MNLPPGGCASLAALLILPAAPPRSSNPHPAAISSSKNPTSNFSAYIENGDHLKCCTCPAYLTSSPELKQLIGTAGDDEYHVFDDDDDHHHHHNHRAYSLIFSKQMVSIFLSIWVRRELVPYVSHCWQRNHGMPRQQGQIILFLSSFLSLSLT